MVKEANYLLPSETSNKELSHLEKLQVNSIKAKSFVLLLRLKYAFKKKIENYV